MNKTEDQRRVFYVEGLVHGLRIRGARTPGRPFKAALIAKRPKEFPSHHFEQNLDRQFAKSDAPRILEWLRDHLPPATYDALVDLIEKEKSK